MFIFGTINKVMWRPHLAWTVKQFLEGSQGASRLSFGTIACLRYRGLLLYPFCHSPLIYLGPCIKRICTFAGIIISSKTNIGQHGRHLQHVKFAKCSQRKAYDNSHSKKPAALRIFLPHMCTATRASAWQLPRSSSEYRS